MNKSCPALLLRRIALLLVLGGTLPLALRAQVDSANSSPAQVDSTRSSRVHVDSTNQVKVESDRRNNFWLSAGIGPGLHGVAVAGGAWYSNNNLVVGAHGAQVTALWYGPEVHDVSLLVGLRNLNPNTMFMVAVGPAILGGKLYVGDLYVPRTVPNYEVGIALNAQARVNFSVIGIGFDGFVAQSGNRLVEGLTLSLQAGWLGN
jgi:hypothetical protein